MSDFELDPDDRDDDYPYDFAYIHKESGRLWPVVIGVTLMLLALAAYMIEERYTRPPKVETAPTAPILVQGVHPYVDKGRPCAGKVRRPVCVQASDLATNFDSGYVVFKFEKIKNPSFCGDPYGYQPLPTVKAFDGFYRVALASDRKRKDCKDIEKNVSMWMFSDN